jgi:hypothetical protein
MAEQEYEDALTHDKVLKYIKEYTKGFQDPTLDTNSANSLHHGTIISDPNSPRDFTKFNFKSQTAPALKMPSDVLGGRRCSISDIVDELDSSEIRRGYSMQTIQETNPQVRRAVVALGKRLHDNGKPTDVLISRMSTACSAFRKHCKGLDDLMIVTGGKPADLPRSEAEVMRDLAVGRELGAHAAHKSGTTFEFHGVEERQIILEDKARTTLENAWMIREKLEKYNISEIILVTDDFHMRRSHFIFDFVLHKEISSEEKAGLEKVLRPTLIDPNTGIARPLELEVNKPFHCTIQTMENQSPIPEPVKGAEYTFEATLPNSRMMRIIEDIQQGIPEVVGQNQADKMQPQDSKKASKIGNQMRRAKMSAKNRLKTMSSEKFKTPVARSSWLSCCAICNR